MEKELLAALIVDPSQIDRVSALIRDRDFIEPTYRNVYRALLVMRENRIPTDDLAILVRHIKNTGMTMAEVASLVGSGIAANALYYAGVVSEAGRRRRLSDGLLGALNAMSREGSDLEEVIGQVEAMLETERATAETAAVHIGEAGQEVVARLKERPTEAICFSGLWSLDQAAGGFLAGETVVIAARPGVGKTALAMQIGLHNARQGRPGLFVSLEMSRTELVARVLCGMAEVDNLQLRRGQVTASDVQKIEAAAAEARSIGCWIWDPPKATVSQIESMAKLAVLKHNIRWLVVDYIGLIGTGGRRVDRREHIGHCSRTLKELSKELGIPVFILAQLNREAANNVPGLEHLKESGDIEQDADVVLFVHKTTDWDKQRDEYKLIVAKHRHGEIGSKDIEFDGKRTLFTDPNVITVGRSNNAVSHDPVKVNGSRWDV
jgi:replicative DNA helicase